MVGGVLLVIGGVLAVVRGSAQVRRGVDGDGPLPPGGPTFGPWRRVLTGSTVIILGLTLVIGGVARVFTAA
jgi:hypothetical protein